jgi:copper oxidase (laccase) domain-containing protein
MDSAVLLAMSNVADGSMSTGADGPTRLRNRTKFLALQGITAQQTGLVYLRYEGEDYRRYATVASDFAGDGIVRPTSMVSDALFTTTKGLALLLPIADCVAAVLYDARHGVIGLAHLGRHNLVQSGGEGVVSYMTDQFGTDPVDLQVHLSAGAGRERYPLFDFDGRGLQEVAVEQLRKAGIDPSRIGRDERDTTTDNDLFSHSEYLQGRQAIDGRQAFVAMMRP